MIWILTLLNATLLRQSCFGNKNAGGGFGNQGLIIQNSVWFSLPQSTRDYVESKPNYYRLVVDDDPNRN